MKNNTKVRLHLSKSLFENIVKEVLSEAKKMNMSGGAYTESVKMPKKAKKMEETNQPSSTSTTSVQTMNAAGYGDKPAIPGLREKEIKEVDAVTDSERMRKMHEMSSKEKMEKGLYKEADMAKLKNAKAKIEKKLAEMEINVEEGYYEDIEGYTSVSDNGTGFKDNDKVKSKDGQEGFVYDVLKSKEGKALVVVKWQRDGMTSIAKYGEGFGDISVISKAMGEMQINVAEEEEALGVGHKFANGIEIKYAVGTKFDTSEMTSGNIPPGIWVITKYQPNGNVEVKCESGKYEGKPALWNIIGLQNFLKNGMKVVSENSQMNEIKKKVMPTLNELRKQIKNK